MNFYLITVSIKILRCVIVVCFIDFINTFNIWHLQRLYEKYAGGKYCRLYTIFLNSTFTWYQPRHLIEKIPLSTKK